MKLLKRLFGKSERESSPRVRVRVSTRYEVRERTDEGRAAATARARARTALRDEYLTREEEAEQLVRNADGLPTARLIRDRDRLLLKTDTGGLVNPKSTYTYKLGIYQFSIRGTGHHGNAPKSGDFSLGAPLRLEREPDNEHDSNAVAVYACRARAKSGYVNKVNARRIAERLDRGDELVAISVRGHGPGRFEIVPHILVAAPDVMQHLIRELNLKLPFDAQ